MSQVNAVKHNVHAAEQAVLEKFSKKLQRMGDKERSDVLAKFKSELSKGMGDANRIPSEESQNEVDGSNQAGGKPDVGNSSNQIVAGPAALAAPMIYKMMQMYTELIGLEQKQKVSAVDIQSTAAIGQADAQESAADWAGWTTIIGGAVSVIGGLASAGISSKMASDPANEAEMKDIETNMAPAKELDSMFETIPGEETIGALIPDARAGYEEVGEGVFKPFTNKEVDERIAAIKDGGHLRVDEEGKLRETNIDLKSELSKKAVARWKGSKKPEDIASRKDQQKRLAQKTQEYNAKGDKLMAASNSRTIYNQMVNQFFTLGDKTSQGIGTLKKGAQDAAATLQQATSSQASGISQESGKRMGEDYQNAVKALDALRGIQEAHARG